MQAKHLIRFAALAAMVLTVIAITGAGGGGCAFTEPLRSKPIDEPPAIAAARVAIEEQAAAVTAFNNVITENVNARVWTKAQAAEYGAAADNMLETVERARTLLRLGDAVGAKAQAELVKEGLRAIQRQIAAKARGAT